MAIPSISQHTVECIQTGTVAAAGSNAKTSQQVTHWYRNNLMSQVINKLAFDTAYASNIASVINLALNIRYTWANNSVRILEDPLDLPLITTHSHAGAITGDSMPLTCSAYLLKRTGVRGKSARGSMRLYPISESDSTVATDDELNAAALTRMTAICTALQAGFTDSTGLVWNLVVYSRKTSYPHLLPVAAIASYPTSSVTPRKTIGHMRHRQVKSVY